MDCILRCIHGDSKGFHTISVHGGSMECILRCTWLIPKGHKLEVYMVVPWTAYYGDSDPFMHVFH